MAANRPSLSDFWKSPATAKEYEADTGGVTKDIAKDLVVEHLKSNSLSGKVVLDNACGPGIVTRVLLSHITDIIIEAGDISQAMIDELKQRLISEGWTDAKVNAQVMDAEALLYPDDTFDVTLTVMGIMLLPNPEKGLEELYRVTKPGGKCYFTTWHKLETSEIAHRVVQRLRGHNGTFDIPPVFWKPEMQDPKYLVSELERIGFKECGAKIVEKRLVYLEQDAIGLAMRFIRKLFQRFLIFKDGEEEQWDKIWIEELNRLNTEVGITFKMWPIYVWGTK